MLYVFNFLIIFILLYSFDLIGYIFTKKCSNKKPVFNIPLGFFVFLGFFQIINLIPMYLHANFIGTLIINVILFTSIILFISIKYGKEWLDITKKNLKLPIFKAFLIIAPTFGLILFLFATSSIDSWLFAPMTLSSIDNNIIFSNNGTEVNGVIQSLHGFDSFYLLQGFLAKISQFDGYFYITSFTKFLEGILITSSFALMINYFFKKNQTMLFIIIIITIIFGFPTFTNYPNFHEVSIQTYKMLSLGTNMMNLLFPFVFYIYYREQNNNYRYLLPLIISGALSLSSSAILVVGGFLVTSVIYDLFIEKTNTNKESYLSSSLTLSFFVIFYFLSSKIYLQYILLINLIVTILIFIIYYFIKNIHYKNLLKFVKLLLIIVAVSMLIVFTILPTGINVLTNIFFLETTTDVASEYYFDPLGNIIVFLLTAFGFYSTFKEDKKLFYYSVIGIIIFANPVSYYVLGLIIPKIIYHRLYAIILIPIIFSFGFNYIIEITSSVLKVKSKEILIVLSMIIVALNPNIIGRRIEGYENFIEYKYVNEDVYDLRSFNFKKTNNVDINVPVNKHITSAQTIHQIFQVRGDLNWIYENNKVDHYLIIPKNQYSKEKTLYETNGYKIVFIEGEKDE